MSSVFRTPLKEAGGSAPLEEEAWQPRISAAVMSFTLGSSVVIPSGAMFVEPIEG